MRNKGKEMIFKVEALQYDGTYESIKKFAENSYSFPAEDTISVVINGKNLWHKLKPGEWVVRFPYSWEIWGDGQMKFALDTQPIE